MNYNDVPGWFDFEGHYNRIIASAPPGSTLVEVGVWHGKSVIYLAERAAAAQKGLTIYAVDTFMGSTEHQTDLKTYPPGWLMRMFNHNIRVCNVVQSIIPITLPSVDATKFFPEGSVFSVYIDAEHTYDSVKADILAWRPKIQPGGFIGGHDYLWDPATVARAVNECLPQRQLEGSTWYQQL